MPIDVFSDTVWVISRLRLRDFVIVRGMKVNYEARRERYGNYVIIRNRKINLSTRGNLYQKTLQDVMSLFYNKIIENLCM